MRRRRRPPPPPPKKKKKKKILQLKKVLATPKRLGPLRVVYLYTLAVSPSLGVSRQHKRNYKTMGISLRSSSNDEEPSRVWMALLEQHSPSSPVFHNLRRFMVIIINCLELKGLIITTIHWYSHQPQATHLADLFCKFSCPGVWEKDWQDKCTTG